MLFIDTESIGFFGATMLFQYGRNEDDINLHYPWDRPIKETLELIESWTDETIVAYNISHDAFHINRTYNILKFMDLMGYEYIDMQTYYNLQDQPQCKIWCWKPKECIDLMIYGKRGELQSVLKQRPITIKRVPIEMSNLLIEALDIPLPDIMFSKGKTWKIIRLKTDGETVSPEERSKKERGLLDFEYDESLVNLRLDFTPSRGLKSIAKYVLDFDDTEDYDGDKGDECSWNPHPDWRMYFETHNRMWKREKKIKYAKNDILYLMKLYDYFDPHGDDLKWTKQDSMIAVMSGAKHWSGFSVDTQLACQMALNLGKKVEEYKSVVSYNSPRKILDYLHEVCSPEEQIAVINTKKETLKMLSMNPSNSVLANRAKLILDARNVEMEYRLVERLVIAKKLYVTFNVSGTRTNRQSGGDAVNKSESINPQGIKKGEIRKLMTFTDNQTPCHSGGDFSGFEVTIFVAVTGCKKLETQLLTGMKIHAIWGSMIFGMTYEDVLATDGIKASEENGYYSRAKNSFFAFLYGAQIPKIALMTWKTESEIAEGFERLHKEYPEIRDSQDRIAKMFQLIQHYEFCEPRKDYVENLYGFRRYFTNEIMIVKYLHNLMNTIPDELFSIGEGIRVIRRTKAQDGNQAIKSAIMAVIMQFVSSIVRVANNFVIQSVGGETTKHLEYRLNEFQPSGCNQWQLKTFNVHDELRIGHTKELEEPIRQTVKEFINEYKKYIPLIEMEWESGKHDWYKKPKAKTVPTIST